jgi:hypothetical protein
MTDPIFDNASQVAFPGKLGVGAQYVVDQWSHPGLCIKTGLANDTANPTQVLNWRYGDVFPSSYDEYSLAPAVRTAHVLDAACDRVLFWPGSITVFGGYCPRNCMADVSGWEWDPADDTWTEHVLTTSDLGGGGPGCTGLGSTGIYLPRLPETFEEYYHFPYLALSVDLPDGWGEAGGVAYGVEINNPWRYLRTIPTAGVPSVLAAVMMTRGSVYGDTAASFKEELTCTGFLYVWFDRPIVPGSTFGAYDFALKKPYDTAGSTHGADSAATIYANLRGSSQQAWNQIAPNLIRIRMANNYKTTRWTFTGPSTYTQENLAGTLTFIAGLAKNPVDDQESTSQAVTPTIEREGVRHWRSQAPLAAGDGRWTSVESGAWDMGHDRVIPGKLPAGAGSLGGSPTAATGSPGVRIFPIAQGTGADYDGYSVDGGTSAYPYIWKIGSDDAAYTEVDSAQWPSDINRHSIRYGMQGHWASPLVESHFYRGIRQIVRLKVKDIVEITIDHPDGPNVFECAIFEIPDLPGLINVDIYNPASLPGLVESMQWLCRQRRPVSLVSFRGSYFIQPRNPPDAFVGHTTSPITSLDFSSSAVAATQQNDGILKLFDPANVASGITDLGIQVGDIITVACNPSVPVVRTADGDVHVGYHHGHGREMLQTTVDGPSYGFYPIVEGNIFNPALNDTVGYPNEHIVLIGNFLHSGGDLYCCANVFIYESYLNTGATLADAQKIDVEVFRIDPSSPYDQAQDAPSPPYGYLPGVTGWTSLGTKTLTLEKSFIDSNVPEWDDVTSYYYGDRVEYDTHAWRCTNFAGAYGTAPDISADWVQVDDEVLWTIMYRISAADQVSPVATDAPDGQQYLYAFYFNNEAHSATNPFPFAYDYFHSGHIDSRDLPPTWPITGEGDLHHRGRAHPDWLA